MFLSKTVPRLGRLSRACLLVHSILGQSPSSSWPPAGFLAIPAQCASELQFLHYYVAWPYPTHPFSPVKAFGNTHRTAVRDKLPATRASSPWRRGPCSSPSFVLQWSPIKRQPVRLAQIRFRPVRCGKSH
ncbi:hypothetical protein B0I37DRAFT_232675 [Chaetomium sp. MPI-CAGE-AT-0009]|nr:hypothetical protein B0I37DRAFT_232675 [Chaetomium sp. MPI-CAGE-AT-0009]